MLLAPLLVGGLGLCGCQTGMGVGLPSGWHDMGRTARATPSALSTWQYRSVVDENGDSFLYAGVDGKVYWASLVSDERRALGFYGRGRGAVWFRGRVTSPPIPEGSSWIPWGPGNLLYLRGNAIGFEFDGSTRYLVPSFYLVATINGSEFGEQGAEQSLLQNGLSIGLGMPYGVNLNREDRTGLVHIVTPSGPAAIVVPKDVEFQAIKGGVRAHQKQLFAWNWVGRGTQMLRIDFSHGPASVSRLALWPTSRFSSASLAQVLADGSVCQVIKEPPNARAKPHYSTAICDKVFRGWNYYPGLIVYATSFNGRYVLYGEEGSTEMREARVDG